MVLSPMLGNSVYFLFFLGKVGNWVELGSSLFRDKIGIE